MRWLALLLLVGCHGTDVRVGTGHTFDGGRSLGSVSGKHDTGGSWLVDEGGGSSAWVEMGFQLTPQTVRLVDERVGTTVIYPPPEPPPVLSMAPEPKPMALEPKTEVPTEDPDIDWEEVVVAVALGLIPLLFGGRHVVKKVRAKRAKKEADV